VRKLESLGYVGGDDDGTTASYAHLEDNPFRLVKDAPLSTFSIDVDTASYSNVRRFLNSGRLPPPGAVRLEEMVNYFPYQYAEPTDGRPFAVRVDVAACPWKTDHRLVRVGLKGKTVATSARPAANLVFLLDVSGSMQPQSRLPLILESMKLLVGQLDAKDRVAIVVYAGESGVALPSTSCEDKPKILAALGALHAGGSTNGASGINLAYDIAAQNRIDGGINRVVLATDGDFNVGVTDESSLVTLIQEKAKTGTFLSVLGVGDDNYKDSTMEMLAGKGNGNYAYIDTLDEGKKVLVSQTNGTLVAIAKDVKIQVEFNPSQVGSYRLIGYEDRVLATEDFRNDKKDAGEIGAGHTVTALYEVVPPGVLATESVGVEPLKYQQPPAATGSSSRELLTVKLRWKEPNSDVSTPMEVPVVDEGMSYSAASPDFKFAAAVAAFGMSLRHSPHKGNITTMGILELATEGAANDPDGHRAEFLTLLKRAVELGAK
jgi:Ca-activated chloride channel family protein